MISHLVGTKPCPNAPKAAKLMAKRLRGDKPSADDTDDSAADGSSQKKRKLDNSTSNLKQAELKVYKGISVPFSEQQSEAIKKQFLRATISANLPFRWTEDIEVIKLLQMFRSAASDVIPARKVLAGRLLNDEGHRVEQELEKVLKGKYVVLACVQFPL